MHGVNAASIFNICGERSEKTYKFAIDMICCHFVRRLVMYGLTGSQYQTLAGSQSKITEQESQPLNAALVKTAKNLTWSRLKCRTSH